MTEDEMVGWDHQLDGHEFQQTLGDSEGQGSLACCSPWGQKELDLTQWLSNNNSNGPGCPVLRLCLLMHQFNSVAQSYPTLQPREPQHTRPPRLSPAPRVYPNPCPSSR